MTINEAIELFGAGKYREAFVALTECYAACKSQTGQAEIFAFLKEAYLQPNLEEMEANYAENLALLGQYPYAWEIKQIQMDQLPFYLFPVVDNEYCIYDKGRKTFSEVKLIETQQMSGWLFKDLDKPLFFENLLNRFELQFLCDNVRRSEDYGADNHIYLYYENFEALAPLLMLCGLAPLLKGQKFVFLVGENCRGKYPPTSPVRAIKTDYRKTARPIQIAELKRVCFWYKHAISGTVLSLEALGANQYVQMVSGHDFHTYSTIGGTCLYFQDSFRDLMGHPDNELSTGQIRELAHAPGTQIKIDDLDRFLDWLEKQRSYPHRFTVSELFRGYFLFKYESRGLNPRVVPVCLYDPHMWDTSVYNQIILSFPYYTVLTCMREPIMTFARAYARGIAGWNQFQTQYILSSDYMHAQFLPPEMLDHYYGFRFEDLKQMPEKVFYAVCRLLDIPFEPEMLDTEAPMQNTDSSGGMVKGFDTAPLHRDISTLISDFDKLRLQIFYEPIHRHYGYPGFDSKEYPLPGELVRQLFSYPFRFERFLYPNVSAQQLHGWVEGMLLKAWGKKITCPKLLDLEEATQDTDVGAEKPHAQGRL